MPNASALRLLPDIVKDIKDADKVALRDAAFLTSYQNGDYIIREGTTPSYLVMVQSGYCSVETMGRVLDICGPGGVMGPTLLEGAPLFSSMRALGPVVIMAFDLKILQGIFLRNPETLLKVFDVTLHRAYKYQAILHNLGGVNIEVKYAAILWSLGTPQKDGSRRIPDVITQADIASLLRTTREEISRKRKLLVTAGYLFSKQEETGMHWYLSAEAPLLFEGQDWLH